MENNEFVRAYMNMAERREPHSKFKSTRLSGERKKQEAAYREARVEVLRKLYEDNPVEEERNSQRSCVQPTRAGSVVRCHH